MTKHAGFTLIEVLLALAVIAIALTALIKSTAQTVVGTARLKDKSISHWVGTQGVTMIQLGLLNISSNQPITQVTNMLGQRWYWRASMQATPIKNLQKISITVSKYPSGPFGDELLAFKITQ
ncbi:MAG TPA: type II secretion system protein GspI [Legionella sp.]|nr:type II secretion system protein GspI [Legionella sp.]